MKNTRTVKRQIEDKVYDICSDCGWIVWGGTFAEINNNPAEVKSTRKRKALNHKCGSKKSGY